MEKLTKIVFLLSAATALVVNAPSAMGGVWKNWDGSAGTIYWNDPVPTSDNHWGNWDEDPTTVVGDIYDSLELGSSNTVAKSDISAWPIYDVKFWPSSTNADDCGRRLFEAWT